MDEMKLLHYTYTHCLFISYYIDVLQQTIWEFYNKYKVHYKIEIDHSTNWKDKSYDCSFKQHINKKI